MEKAVVFVESNTSGTGYILASIAFEKGYKPIVITNNLSRYDFDKSVEPHIVDTNNFKEIRDKVVSLMNIYDIKGIISTSDYYLDVVAKLAEEFRFSSTPLLTIDLCRNKDRFREHMRDNKLLTPDFKTIENENDLDLFIKKQTISFPLIVKPVQGSGSIGVKLISEREEFRKHSMSLLHNKVNERGQKINSSILIEEFINGEEFSLELFNGEVVGITKKYKSELPYFVELGHDFPYMPEEGFRKNIMKTIEKLKNCFDLSFGVFHIEFIKSEEEIYIVEINPRLAGGCIPILIKESLDIDILELSLENIIGKVDKINFNPKKFASIRFVIPEHNGKVEENLENQFFQEFSSKVQIKSYKKDLKNYSRTYDFRDRIGHVIVSNFDKQKSIDEVDEICKRMHKSLIYVDKNDTGRISKGIHEEIKKIVFGDKVESKDIQELRFISLINKAHVIMLNEEGVLKKTFAKDIISEIKKLEEINFSPLMEQKTPRGLYMLYEQYLIDKLGMDIAGNMHLGRSRNDINATLTRIQVKKDTFEIIHKLIIFSEELLSLSDKYEKTIMPSYTHYQPAVPMTYGFYLQGVINSLLESIKGFLNVVELADVSPLGSCSVGGTSIPVNQEKTASYLGFKQTTKNALFGVASRDFVLSLLGQISITSVLISRIASDFMLWNTQEFNFFNLADSVVGSSSIMPNKRNPFVLENIQGKSGVIASSFIGAVMAMQKTPFTNSISVGTESKMFLDKTQKEFLDSIHLLQVFINHSVPNEPSMKEKAINSHTMATELANKLVLNHNIPFRQAHFIVGKAVSEALENNISLEETNTLSSYELNVSIQEIVELTKYGGGPSSINISENRNFIECVLKEYKDTLDSYIFQMDKAIELMEKQINNLT